MYDATTKDCKIDHDGATGSTYAGDVGNLPTVPPTPAPRVTPVTSDDPVAALLAAAEEYCVELAGSGDVALPAVLKPHNVERLRAVCTGLRALVDAGDLVDLAFIVIRVERAIVDRTPPLSYLAALHHEAVDLLAKNARHISSEPLLFGILSVFATALTEITSDTELALRDARKASSSVGGAR